MQKKSRLIITIIVFIILMAIGSSKFIFADAIYNVSDFGQLQYAVNKSNDGDTIIVDSDIVFTERIEIHRKLKIIGSSNYTLTIQSGYTDLFFKSKADLEIENLTFDGVGAGGGIEMTSGSINVTNSNFINNNSLNRDPQNNDPLKISGAAINIPTSLSATITNSTFKNNVAFEGGAIYTKGRINITNCEFDSNKMIHPEGEEKYTSINGGGAIKIDENYKADIVNTIFKNNSGYEGGAIYTKGDIIITNCEFDNNKTTHSERRNEKELQGQYTNIYGGGALCALSDATVSNSIFTNNTSYTMGGAIYGKNSLTLTGCLFQNNGITSPKERDGSAIYTARSNGSLTIEKCQFTSNYGGSCICTFKPIKTTNSCFDSNGDGNGSSVSVAVTRGDFTNCTFTNSGGPAIMAYDNPVHYPDPNDIPLVNFTNCTFWNNHGSRYFEEIIFTYFYETHPDGTKTPSRWPKDKNTGFFNGCILTKGPQKKQGYHIEANNCEGYDDGPVNELFTSDSPTLNNFDTKIKIGTGNETLKIGYFPIKPFGRADDKIDSSIVMGKEEQQRKPQEEDQNGVKRGQEYNDGKTYVDVGAIEELGNIYDKKVSGDNQVAIVNSNFTDPLIVEAYYESTTQIDSKTQLPLKVPLKDFVFTSVTPNPAANGASATLSANTANTTIVKLDDKEYGYAQVKATANDKPGQYTVTFVPSDDYKKRKIVRTDKDNDSANYFGDIDFTLTNISKTIHVRQVVINSAPGLEIPHSGYMVLKNSDSSDINNITVDSGKYEFGVDYTTFLMNAKPKSEYEMTPIIPEYYDYAGFTITETNVEHNPDDIIGSADGIPPEFPSVDFNSDTTKEYWVTIYITPKNPDAYSWSDAVNDFFTQNN